MPKVDLKNNLKIYQALESAIQKELVSSSISVGSGGLAAALAKACVGGMLGAKISVKNLDNLNIDAKLFSESQGRILVSVSPKNAKIFEKLMQGILIYKLGAVSKNSKVIIDDAVKTDVKKLHKIYHTFSEKMR